MYLQLLYIYFYIYLIAILKYREERNMYASIQKDINDSARVKRSMDVYFFE